MKQERTLHPGFPICEAGCGLRVTMDGKTIVRIRGNDDDLFTESHLCPKGVALVQTRCTRRATGLAESLFRRKYNLLAAADVADEPFGTAARNGIAVAVERLGVC